MHWLVPILLLSQVLLLGSCHRSLSADLGRYDPPTASAKAIELYDRDSDGQLSAEELKESPALAASLRRLDSNRDGKLSAEEIQARLEQVEPWPKFLGLDATVTSRGRPLVGAEVTLTPEPFMGSGYETLSGTTVEGGGYLLGDDGRQIAGVPTGFYTVRIVHPGQNIDAGRGVEIASDTTGSRLEIAL